MTFGRGQANRPVGAEQDASLSIQYVAGALRNRFERVPQPAEPFTRAQRDIDHMMRCTKVGCTRCAD